MGGRNTFRLFVSIFWKKGALVPLLQINKMIDFFLTNIYHILDTVTTGRKLRMITASWPSKTVWETALWLSGLKADNEKVARAQFEGFHARPHSQACTQFSEEKYWSSHSLAVIKASVQGGKSRWCNLVKYWEFQRWPKPPLQRDDKKHSLNQRWKVLGSIWDLRELQDTPGDSWPGWAKKKNPESQCWSWEAPGESIRRLSKSADEERRAEKIPAEFLEARNTHDNLLEFVNVAFGVKFREMKYLHSVPC